MADTPIIGIASETVPYGWPEARRRDIPGYVLDNGIVLLESDRDDAGRYKGGAGMDGMYIQTGRLFEAVHDEDGRISGFTEYLPELDKSGSEPELDFSMRYMVGHGTSIYHTFATAAELNAWYDAQDSHGRYFCKLYDREKEINVPGSAYMYYDESQRWKDEAPEQEKPSVREQLKRKPLQQNRKTAAPKKNTEMER